MKASLIAMAAVVTVLAPLGCERSGDGGSASPPSTTSTPAPTPAPTPPATPQALTDEAPRPVGGIGLSGGGTQPPASTSSTSGQTPSASGSIDWSAVAPSDQRAARDALYGIIRIIDLEHADDSGQDILSFEPGAGPRDSQGTVYSPITVHSATYHIDDSIWLGLFNLVQNRQDGQPDGFVARPLPDARYGDGERSTRGNLLFTLVVDDAEQKTLKIAWQRQ